MDDQTRPRKTQPRTTAKASTVGTTSTTPGKRAPRKAARKVVATEAVAAEILDDRLLAHLDAVLAEMETPVVVATPVASPQPPRAPLWARVVVDPGFTAEHLAREAVGRLGPSAKDWVDRTRARYPGARPDALARLAVAEQVRAARLQAMTIAGSLANVGTLARTHARLILTVAAAYGVDPTAEARVVDLLELLPVPRLTQPTLAAAGNVGRVMGAIAVRRIAARVVPFGASIAGAIHSGRTTEDIARRAVDRFRPKR
jgi:hypothetical protein